MRIIGLCCVKNEAEFMGEVLESHLRLCDSVLVLDDRSDDGTWEILQQFRARMPERVHLWRNPANLPRNEARDRNFLFDRVHVLGLTTQDWCWWFDGDETVYQGNREDVRGLPEEVNTVFTSLPTTWIDETQYCPVMSVEKRHLFRYIPKVCDGYHWQGRGKHGLHCGACPRTDEYQAEPHTAYSPGIVELHWGWCTIERVREKVARYRKQDPGFASFKPYRKYDRIAREGQPWDVTPIGEFRGRE